MGDLTITNRAGKDDPSPENGLLVMVLENFRVVLQYESMHGIKAPKVPELIKPRDSVVGSKSLAKKLLQDQREKAAAHTRTSAFYAKRHDPRLPSQTIYRRAFQETILRRNHLCPYSAAPYSAVTRLVGKELAPILRANRYFLENAAIIPIATGLYMGPK
jgi:hypothetical protein